MVFGTGGSNLGAKALINILQNSEDNHIIATIDKENIPYWHYTPKDTFHLIYKNFKRALTYLIIVLPKFISF